MGSLTKLPTTVFDSIHELCSQVPLYYVWNLPQLLNHSSGLWIRDDACASLFLDATVSIPAQETPELPQCALQLCLSWLQYSNETVHLVSSFDGQLICVAVRESFASVLHGDIKHRLNCRSRSSPTGPLSQFGRSAAVEYLSVKQKSNSTQHLTPSRCPKRPKRP